MGGRREGIRKARDYVYICKEHPWAGQVIVTE
jgi:hypothetical protein